MAEEDQANQGCCRRHCHLEYFRTLEGIGKLIEFIIVTLGLILMATISAINASAIKFFIFVHTTGMIFILIHIFLRVIGVFHRLPLIIISNLTYIILCAVGAVAFLICSAITLNKYGDNTVKAASVIGLIAMGLFIAETIYHFIQHRRGASRQQTEMKQSTQNETATEQPPSY